jgi:hypothetical protein
MHLAVRVAVIGLVGMFAGGGQSSAREWKVSLRAVGRSWTRALERCTHRT